MVRLWAEYTVTFKERVVHGETATGHIVQLFDTEDSLARTIAAFAADGLLSEETVLIVARPAHWARMQSEMAALACDVERARADGQLVVLDAAATMDQFMVGGSPKPALFEPAVGSLVRQLLLEGRPLRIYGEMVDLLAEERDYAAAQSLEEMWNHLARECAYTLFCGYSAVHFGDPRSSAALDLICRCHSEVRESTEDDLGTWLIRQRRDSRLPARP